MSFCCLPSLFAWVKVSAGVVQREYNGGLGTGGGLALMSLVTVSLRSRNNARAMIPVEIETKNIHIFAGSSKCCKPQILH